MKFSGLKKSLPVLVAALAILNACAKAKYGAENIKSSAVAGQYITTKPKIDIIVFQDNSDSVMYTHINKIRPQMESFVNGLNGSWDFRFIVLPLLSQKTLNSKYVISSDCSGISGILACLPPSQASTFNYSSGDYGWINSANSAIGSQDKGFQNMYYNLQSSSMVNSGFLRPDAALAVIVLTNGEDIDGMTYHDPDGDGTPQLNYNSGVSQYNFYRDYFENFKGTPSLMRFFSVVSDGSCGINGRRYRDMADELGSRSYNLCNSEMNSVLSNIGSQMVAITQAVVFNYHVLPNNPGTITSVLKNNVPIPQSSSNGWEYVGYKTNQNTSFFPTPGNPKTGYMIKLNGSAVIQGSDRIDVIFQSN
jgi:hypothetical protein